MVYSLFPGHITVDEISFLYPSTLQVAVLRLDKLHPVISGNKWFKLRFFLAEALRQKKGLVTFGGAWSNHIVATAAACRLNNLASIGIIRGEEPAVWSSALQDAKACGMQLHFISRTSYKEKHVPEALHAIMHKYLLVPEGGYGATGATGAATIMDFLAEDYTHYICAAGTGTMTAGLINAAPPGSEVIGISMLKNNHSLEQAVKSLLHSHHASWQLLHGYHGGGYARHNPALLEFMNDLYEKTGIPTDIVYTGKLFFAASELIRDSFFPPGSRILIIHSGGLQGNRSLPKGSLIF